MIVLPELIEEKIRGYLIKKLDIDELWDAIKEKKGIITAVQGFYFKNIPENRQTIDFESSHRPHLKIKTFSTPVILDDQKYSERYPWKSVIREQSFRDFPRMTGKSISGDGFEISVRTINDHNYLTMEIYHIDNERFPPFTVLICSFHLNLIQPEVKTSSIWKYVSAGGLGLVIGAGILKRFNYF